MSCHGKDSIESKHECNRVSKVKCAAAGAATGVVNGLFGFGGGLILLPALTRFVRLDDRCALATSIMVIAPICVLSAIIYICRGGIDLVAAAPFVLGGLVGGYIGGRLFTNIPTTLLRRGFGAIIIYGAVRALMF